MGKREENLEWSQDIWNVDRSIRWCWNENAISYPLPPNQAFLTSLLQNLGIFSKNLPIFINIYILFVVVKNLESIDEHYWSTTIAFLPSSYTRSLQIKAFQITTSNSGNFKVLCKISLTNFLPFASYWIRHQIYIIHIKSSYQIPPDQGFQGHYFKLRELQGTMQHFSHKFRSFRFQSN